MGNDKSKRNPLALSEKEIQLLLHKTDLSREQILDWHRDFIEEHPDGHINHDEFIRLFKGVIDSDDDSDRYAQALFDLFDDEKKDKLSLSDFLVLTPFEVRRHANIEDAQERRQREIDDVDDKTLELALDILNDRADKIDKEELYKAPYVLCEAAGQNALEIFDTDEQFAKKKFFIFDNDKLDRDEFLRLIRGCKRFLV